MDLKKIFGLCAIVLLIFGAFFLVSPGVHAKEQQTVNSTTKTFSSCSELKGFLQENSRAGYYGGYGFAVLEEMAMDSANAPSSSGMQKSIDAVSSDFSGTNVQVSGVDEADMIKSDGKYLYVLTGENLVIVDAYPADSAKKISSTNTRMYANELFVNGDKLVLFGYDNYGETKVLIYDISDRKNPGLEEELSVDGYYVSSRMIGDYVYLVASESTYYWLEGGRPLPSVQNDGPELLSEEVSCESVKYFDEVPEEYSFTTLVSIDLDSNEVSSELFLTGSAEDMYVSADNIYIINADYGYGNELAAMAVEITTGISMIPEYSERTIIHKLSIENGEFKYVGKGEVPGHTLNQFSMDEYDGNFRIATTIGNVARNAEDATSSNNLYVLDENLEVIGSLENLAPGEKIYSARFMGKRAYLVTFRKVDPLFVIDLSEPEDPEVLGKLKIPGYSDYLHPYDENHVIGLGKDAIPADEGDFSWYQGVKLSLFDVTDVESPKELSTVTIGDRGTDSYALQDHRAFLFSREKNLLVIPVLLAEIHEEQYPEGLEPYAYGDYTFQGAYVFSVSSEDGFGLKGRISHMEDEDEFEKSGYYFGSDYSVKRSLYMDDVLYTVSDMKIKMNSLDSLDEVNEIFIK